MIHWLDDHYHYVMSETRACEYALYLPSMPIERLKTTQYHENV